MEKTGLRRERRRRERKRIEENNKKMVVDSMALVSVGDRERESVFSFLLLLFEWRREVKEGGYI